MKGQTKAKLIVFFSVAIIAFATNSIATTIFMIENPNDNTLPAIENDNFTPRKVEYVPTYIPEPKIINETNLTNKTDLIKDTNMTEILNNTKNNISNLINDYSNW
ncbi:hypothetical protein [uncultured Methanobrevibacter sp.]|uniref:hypothetical protein n=1 Tax=uncultured Methanobrevibacter sp. TaxID=253161 RepID=UPI002639AC12|nr:hypothetical protein [uncultured Methanobrevibacter sp.]